MNKLKNSVVLVAMGFYFLDAYGRAIDDRKYIAGSIIECVRLQKGKVLVFTPLVEEVLPVQEEKGGVEWVVEEE